MVRDLTTVQTETGQLYVVMPLPASVKAAMTPTVQPPAWTQQFPVMASLQDKPTPRLANRHPDMTGTWTPDATGGYGNRRCGATQTECNGQVNFTVDYEFYWPTRYGPSRPFTSPSSGTRCNISTSGRTRKIRS